MRSNLKNEYLFLCCRCSIQTQTHTNRRWVRKKNLIESVWDQWSLITQTLAWFSFKFCFSHLQFMFAWAIPWNNDHHSVFLVKWLIPLLITYMHNRKTQTRSKFETRKSGCDTQLKGHATSRAKMAAGHWQT